MRLCLSAVVTAWCIVGGATHNIDVLKVRLIICKWVNCCAIGNCCETANCCVIANCSGELLQGCSDMTAAGQTRVKRTAECNNLMNLAALQFTANLGDTTATQPLHTAQPNYAATWPRVGNDLQRCSKHTAGEGINTHSDSTQVC